MVKLSRSQIAGVAAVGALVVLTGVAFYSSRQAAAPSASASPAGSAATPAPEPEATNAPSSTEIPPVKAGKGVVTAQIEDVMLTPKARLLAERFKCVCGCGDILAACTCKMTPGSRDMKKYLQELVNEGKTPSEVEAAMVERYGAAVRP
jgi:cytochrome c-type biogenesis protein CcmH/NrfF